MRCFLLVEATVGRMQDYTHVCSSCHPSTGTKTVTKIACDLSLVFTAHGDVINLGVANVRFVERN